MTRLFGILLCFFALSAATSCNDDVFIDSNELPEVTDLAIDGDGGYASLLLPRKGLLEVGMSYIPGQETTYLDAAGNSIPFDSRFPLIATIQCRGTLFDYCIRFEGKYLMIESTENCSGAAVEGSIYLYYDYTTCTINYTIAAGENLIVQSITYSDTFKVVDEVRKMSRIVRVDNHGASTAPFYVYPYKPSSALAHYQTQQQWASGRPVDLRRPDYSDGRWTLSEPHAVVIGAENRIDVPYSETRELIEIPGNTVLEIETVLTYGSATVNAQVCFLTPVTHRSLTADVECFVIMPTVYEIITSHVKE